jgi:hypothetical protein
MSQMYLSDGHLPDHLPRGTQMNVGHYLVADLPSGGNYPMFRSVSKRKDIPNCDAFLSVYVFPQITF